MKYLIAASIGVLALVGCGEGGETASSAPTAAPAARAAPAKSAAETAADARAAEIAAERSRLAGMTTPFASQEEWVAACIGANLDKSICDCTVKKAVERVGVEGLYAWVWEGYVAGDGRARLRSNKFFSDNGISKEDQQGFADAIGTCYS